MRKEQPLGFPFLANVREANAGGAKVSNCKREVFFPSLTLALVLPVLFFTQRKMATYGIVPRGPAIEEPVLLAYLKLLSSGDL